MVCFFFLKKNCFILNKKKKRGSINTKYINWRITNEREGKKNVPFAQENRRAEEKGEARKPIK